MRLITLNSIIIIIIAAACFIFISCSSGSDGGPPAPDLAPPYLLYPVNGLKMSLRKPYFEFKHTNTEIDGIYYDFTLSSSSSFSDIIYYQDNIYPGYATYRVDLPIELEQGRVYFYKSTARVIGFDEFADSAIYSIYIEFIGNNIQNLFMCAGDSITSDFPGQNYPSFLQEYLMSYFGDTARTINEGIPGSFSYELESIMNLLLYGNTPAYSIILIGVNDIRYPANCPDPYNCDTFQNIKDIVNTCIINSSIPVVCTLIPAVGYSGTLFDEQIRALNESLKSYCAGSGIDLIDLYGAVMGYSGDIMELYVDDIHPSVAGHNYIASVMFEYFKNRSVNSSQNLSTGRNSWKKADSGPEKFGQKKNRIFNKGLPLIGRR